MPPVVWDHVDPSTFERMAGVLVQTDHPQAERIDGAGGDEGRDLQLRVNGRLALFEFKSFVGRVNSGRRRQVEQSLQRAAVHQPDEWTVIVPIDLTPSELKWFDRLGAETPFRLRWNGRTWLDRQIAAHPQVRRYFLESGADEAMRMLQQAARERDALANGVPDAIERAQGLVSRLNELDVYYTFHLHADERGTAVIPHPRYRAAALDSPIRQAFTFAFPRDDEGREAERQLQEFVGFGTKVAIDSRLITSASTDGPAA